MEGRSVAFTNAVDALNAALVGMMDALRDEQMTISNSRLDIQTQVKQIDHCLTQLPERLHLARSMFAGCTAQAKQACNSKQPIGCLPPELLLHIFEEIVGDSGFKEHYGRLFKLVKVSSLWKTVVEGSPSLWTRISSTYTLSHVQNILRRSGAKLLLVELQHRNRLSSSGRSAYALPGTWFVKSLQPYMHRIRSMRISELCAEDEAFLSSHGAENLIYLVFTQRIGTASSFSGLFKGSVPMATRLALLEMPLPSCATMFSGLTTLWLSNVSFSVSNFHALLRNNGELTDIYLKYAAVDAVDITAARASLPDISMPKLQSLRVSVAPVEAVLPMLSPIQTSSLQFLSIQTGARGGPMDLGSARLEFLDVLRIRVIPRGFRPFRLFLETFFLANRWVVSNTMFGLQDTACRSRCWVDVASLLNNALTISETLRLMDEVYGDGTAEVITPHLRVSLSEANPILTTGNLRALAIEFPALLTLNVERYASTVCQYLSTQTDEGEWPYPYLKHITFHVHEEADVAAVLAMLRVRRGDTHPLLSSAAYTPLPLSSLSYLDRMEEDYVCALHDFNPEHEDEISFKAGDRILILERDEQYSDGWWQGRTEDGQVGLFPQSYTAPFPRRTLRSPTNLSLGPESISAADLQTTVSATSSGSPGTPKPPGAFSDRPGMLSEPATSPTVMKPEDVTAVVIQPVAPCRIEHLVLCTDGKGHYLPNLGELEEIMGKGAVVLKETLLEDEGPSWPDGSELDRWFDL